MPSAPRRRVCDVMAHVSILSLCQEEQAINADVFFLLTLQLSIRKGVRVSFLYLSTYDLQLLILHIGGL